MEIRPSDPHLQYMGRIDFSDADAPRLIWAGSLVRIAFTGGGIAVTLENHRCYNGLQAGYVLDGREHQLALAEDGCPHTYEIPVSGTGKHTLTVFKRQDSTHYLTLRGFTLADGAALSALPPLPDRKIEVYGDSVSAGSVTEAVDCVAAADPPVYDSVYDNAWHSYPMQAARLLHAQVQLNAQGGLALLDNTGYFDNGRYGLETVYDKLDYLPFTPMTPWDFTRYIPHVVIVAVGQNDQHFDGREQTLDAAQRERWLMRYCGILTDLMRKYPDALFVLTLTVLMHDGFWEQLLDDACERMCSSRVRRFRFTRSGTATPGHPRIPEQCEMACELAEYLDSFGETLWQ